MKVREHIYSDAKLTFHGEMQIPVQTEYSLGNHEWNKISAQYSDVY
jgi:hypothetical protein